MRMWLWGALLALTVAVAGGLVYSASNYTCPVTGEQLPCPACCPLNQAR
ncbi:MAG: hypothetical protein KatS3mg110_3590 [Pirellulaceae bacterium]|nr:MAG: hypothetical protein KatS3mg110_3590 [Pirellulaceae bacterium]